MTESTFPVWRIDNVFNTVHLESDCHVLRNRTNQPFKLIARWGEDTTRYKRAYSMIYWRKSVITEDDDSFRTCSHCLNRAYKKGDLMIPGT